MPVHVSAVWGLNRFLLEYSFSCGYSPRTKFLLGTTLVLEGMLKINLVFSVVNQKQSITCSLSVLLPNKCGVIYLNFLIAG